MLTCSNLRVTRKNEVIAMLIRQRTHKIDDLVEGHDELPGVASQAN